MAQYKEGIGDYNGQIACLEQIVDPHGSNANDTEALKNLARAYEKIKAKGKALEVYKRYLELIKNPSEYKVVKDKIEKLENFGVADAEESEGLIDKIMKIFGK